MRRRTASSSRASSSKRSESSKAPSQDEEENVIYSCAPEVVSTVRKDRLGILVDKYQIPTEFNPHLPEKGEWCCSPLFGFGVYVSYLLASLRFPLNTFVENSFIGLATMKENKGKNVNSGIEEEEEEVQKDFYSDTKEAYPKMDFDVFKVPTPAESSLLQKSSKDVNIMDDASTEPSKDDPKSGDAPSGLSK
ncbi:hypothetical protein SO802_012302 [Lithocarpus litseifolius]|uniref:Uncharacterized protein n=1 Tax=Lithocarpus litseifolius TaxID=425828 RepID=A0AAW2D6A9_9ROSI